MDGLCNGDDRKGVAHLETNASMGLGGNTLAQIIESHCPSSQCGVGVVIEALDAQAGRWQYSLDDGGSWKDIRTDLINRPGHMGLALDREARLRVLSIGGFRAEGVRMVFHMVSYRHGPLNGNYRAYVVHDRDIDSPTISLVLSMAAINGLPPQTHVPRPRNKRLMAQRTSRLAATES